jgi:feruloyl-CoA synthase
MCLLAEPPTIDRGEVTDKGSINQRAVLTHRAETVAPCTTTRCTPSSNPN